MTTTQSFKKLQQQLQRQSYLVAEHTQRARTMIILPGFSLDPQEIAKLKGAEYYEERLLYFIGYLRDPQTKIIFVSSRQIDPVILDYYFDLFSSNKSERNSMKQHWQHVYVGNAKTHRTLTEKVLRSQRLCNQILQHITDKKLAVIRCFNVSASEKALAVKLNIPLFASDPDLLVLGSKSGSRAIFKQAKLAIPVGRENIYNFNQLILAIQNIKKQYAKTEQVVLKYNYSFSGVGNAMLTVKKWPRGQVATEQYIKKHLRPNDNTETITNYLAKFFQLGGIVEAWLIGDEVLSPSVQVLVLPNKTVELVSTHEQILDAVTKQLYLGARFPARDIVHAEILRQAKLIGQQMAKQEVIGPFGIDFIAVEQHKRWRAFPVEINLRKGGTTHPFRTVQLLSNGRQDATGQLCDKQKQPIYYCAYDNIVSNQYKKLEPEQLIKLVQHSGLAYDPATNVGVTLHLLGPLKKYGKFGAICIAHTATSAEQLFLLLKRAVDRYVLDQSVLEQQTKVATLSKVNTNRLIKNFIELAKIASPSGEERVMAERMRELLVQAGAKVRIDQRENVIAKIDGTGAFSEADPILISAHLDTIHPGVNIQPVVRGDVIMSDGTTILGADDKVALAYIVELLRILQEQKITHRPIEIICSVCEEQFAQGVKEVDFSKIKAPVAIVLDGARIGEIDVSSPYIADIVVEVIGKAAHSGVEPERGISAIQIAALAIAKMKLGKVDARTTANIGIITGGKNRNVIPPQVILEGEVRGFLKQRLEEQLEHMEKMLRDAAEHFGGLLSLQNKLILEGYQISEHDPDLLRLMMLMKQVHIPARLRQTNGASDANIMMTRGIKAFDIGIGVHHPHTIEEHVYIADMVKMVELLLLLVTKK